MLAKTWRISDLHTQLEASRDPWRVANLFSPDMAACHDKLFASGASRSEKAGYLAEWLASTNQPCWFGRMEAKHKRLAFCVLTENDLAQSDQEIRVVIAKERRAWKELARKGESHGFLIAVVSKAIAFARRGPTLKDFAESICELYLGARESDEKHHDDLVLELATGGAVVNRRWEVGVNYFSAQGDGLWWHDHRFPGGVAFSMNSVGHMARAKAEELIATNPEMAAKAASVPQDKLAYWALPAAMGIIGAKVAGSKRGTWLVEYGTFPEDKEPPTFDERRARFGRHLANFSHNRYRGHYHTDVSIPSDFFREELWELEKIGVREDLFFTYLHSLADPAYESMGIGIEELLIEESGASNDTP